MAYELKTKKNAANVDDFIAGVEPESKRQDSLKLLEVMRDITGDQGAMWGGTIVGFGKYNYTYASGHSGEWFLAGFSPRKQNLTVYVMAGFDRYEELMSKLGKHKTGKSCLYINKLADVDEKVLRELITESIEAMKAANPD